MPLNAHGSAKKRTAQLKESWQWLFSSAEKWADDQGFGSSEMVECCAVATQWVDEEFAGDPKWLPPSEDEANQLLWAYLDDYYRYQMFWGSYFGIARHELRENNTMLRYLRFRPTSFHTSDENDLLCPDYKREANQLFSHTILIIMSCGMYYNQKIQQTNITLFMLIHSSVYFYYVYGWYQRYMIPPSVSSQEKVESVYVVDKKIHPII